MRTSINIITVAVMLAGIYVIKVFLSFLSNYHTYTFTDSIKIINYSIVWFGVNRLFDKFFYSPPNVFVVLILNVRIIHK